MENFRRMARDFEAAGALTVVRDGAGLVAAWRRLLDRPGEAAEQGRRGREMVDRSRGAVERSVELLRQVVDLAVPPVTANPTGCADAPAGTTGCADAPAGTTGCADAPVGTTGCADAPAGTTGCAGAPAGTPDPD